VGSTGWAGSRAASTEDRIFSSEDMIARERGWGRQWSVVESAVGGDGRRAIGGLGFVTDWLARALTDGSDCTGHLEAQCVARATLKSCDGANRKD
jgi:hypothetical protein